ncbi:MAG: helix-turn-helix domain-containing protein [Deltaproteobacteria bacterium]|nr:helix-turn-helix domain-containing protein [Deltaproteobacteria bacterium]
MKYNYTERLAAKAGIPMQDEFTIGQVATLLGKSYETTRVLARQGHIPVVHYSARKRRVQADALESYLRSASGQAIIVDDGVVRELAQQVQGLRVDIGQLLATRGPSRTPVDDDEIDVEQILAGAGVTK